jgi:hypothetical protein
MNLKSIWTQVVACSALALAATAAQADTYTFTVTGDYTATWQLESTVSPDVAFDGSYFTLWDVPGFSDAIWGVADLSFFHANNGGGLAIEDFYGFAILLLTDGPQLYSGSESSPTFLIGTYALTEYQGSGNYTLTIAATVPEPETYALMLGGLGVVGLIARRRKTEAETTV